MQLQRPACRWCSRPRLSRPLLQTSCAQRFRHTAKSAQKLHTRSAIVFRRNSSLSRRRSAPNVSLKSSPAARSECRRLIHASCTSHRLIISPGLTPGLRLLPHVAADESSDMGGAASVGRCDARRDNRVLQHEGLSYLCHEASSRGAYMRSRADVSWCIRPFMLLV